MNTNDLIQNRTDNQSRMRSYNDSFMPNYYPINFGIPQFMYPGVVLSSNGNYTVVNNIHESTSDHSGLVSPNIDSNLDKPLYRIANWHEIADKYEGNEHMPKCGRLINNVYFTQRATSSDVYMLFDKKSDYINNFVNYYFSDKNLARDQKLVEIMNDKGVIHLSALIKFPKLHQIDSTIDDLVNAFQYNTVVMLVDLNGERGVQRRDKWCPANNHKTSNEKSNEVTNENIIEQSPQTIVLTDNVQSQNQQLYFLPPIIPSPIYTQQPGMINNSGLSSYQPSYGFLPVNSPFQSHGTNQVALNAAQTGHASAVFWPISPQDYGNQNLLQQMPINRFNATSSEISGNRLN